MLKKYFSNTTRNFRELSAYLKIQPGNWGVTRLYLLKNTLALLNEGVVINEICKIENKSIKTITNCLAVASLIGLLEKSKSGYSLTKLGKEVLIKDDFTSEERFNVIQFELISEFVKDNPFLFSNYFQYNVCC